VLLDSNSVPLFILGALSITTLILVGSTAPNAPKGRLEWAYGILLLAFVFEVLCTGIVSFTAYKNRQLGKTMTKSKDAKEAIVRTNSEEDCRFSYINSTYTVVDLNLDESAF